MEFQTRRDNGELRFFNTLADAMQDAKDENVWKVSFHIDETNEQVRLVLNSSIGAFCYAPIILEGESNG